MDMTRRYREGFSRGHAKGLADCQPSFNELLDAAEEVLCELEVITTATQARLALLVYKERPASLGRENCTCDDRESCDECPTLASTLAYLQKLASENQEAA